MLYSSRFNDRGLHQARQSEAHHTDRSSSVYDRSQKIDPYTCSNIWIVTYHTTKPNMFIHRFQEIHYQQDLLRKGVHRANCSEWLRFKAVCISINIQSSVCGTEKFLLSQSRHFLLTQLFTNHPIHYDKYKTCCLERTYASPSIPLGAVVVR